MTFYFRADSSFQIGSGHIIRDLNFASHLKDKGINSVFLCRNLPGNINAKISARGFPILVNEHELNLEGEIAWIRQSIDKAKDPVLVFDHYDIDQQIESHFYPFTKTVVIDDLADRKHTCHLLIDTNYRSNYTDAYTNLVPESCKLFLGPQHAILDQKFSKFKTRTPQKNHNILVFFGGSDPTNETGRFLDSLSKINIPSPVHFKMLIAKSHAHLESIRSFKHSAVTLVIEPENVADLMSRCSYYIGSGGTITWERMFMGLPGIVIAIADNQIPASSALAKDGYHHFAGYRTDVSYANIISQALEDIMQEPSLTTLAMKGRALVSSLNYNSLIDELKT